MTRSITFRNGVTAYLPDPFESRAFRDEMVATAQFMNARFLRDFQRTIATWDNPPRFATAVNTSAQRIEGHTYTRHNGGGKSPELIYYFLNYGTRVRYAKMTPGFVPKTVPRLLGSRPGRGGLDYVTPGFDWGGIQAREWNQVIADRSRRTFDAVADAAMRRAAVRSRHVYR